MRVTTGVLMLLLIALLAGCLGAGEAPEAGDGEAPSGGPGEPGDGAKANEGDAPQTGALEGRVVGEGFAPLEGASVRLAQGGELVGQTTTDGEGRYVFEGLEAGKYRVQFKANCCKELFRNVDVVAGETATLDGNLEPLPSLQPHTEEETWDGLIGCSGYVNGNVLFNPEGACANTDPNNEPIREFQLQPDLQTIVVAMDWDPVPTNPLEELHITLSTDEFGADRFFRAEGPPVIEQTVGPEGAETGPSHYFSEITEPWDVRFMVTAPQENSFVYQQPFTVYYHLYYIEPAPEGASALPS